MAAEQKPKRPLVVYAIALLNCQFSARLLIYVWQVAPVVRPGTDIRSLCVAVGPLFQSSDVLGCTRPSVEAVKLDLLVGGMTSLLLAAFLLITAGGLLCLKKPARSWSITIWGMMLAVGLHDYIRHPYGRPGFRPGYAYFVGGITVILVLLYSSGVPKAFGETE